MTANEKGYFTRNLLTIIIVSFIVLINIIIGIVSIIRNKDADFSFIGQSLLPLWGTWMGTVLAFYFGKSNFETAEKSYDKMIQKLSPDEKLATIRVSNTMIPLEKISYLKYEDSLQTSLKDLLKNQYFQYNN
ncbi:MAG: hypothetical protein RR356_04520 [Bacteroidales bacterium]